MAARLNKRLATQTRDAIQTSMLIKRLTDHVLGDVELSTSQVRGIEVLLKKTLPDLKSTELTGEGGGPIELRRFEFVEPEAPEEA